VIVVGDVDVDTVVAIITIIILTTTPTSGSTSGTAGKEILEFAGCLW
jgi:hypothetical protein